MIVYFWRQVPRSSWWWGIIDMNLYATLTPNSTPWQSCDSSFKTGWWFQPIWKICSSNWMIPPGIGVKIKNIWVATTLKSIKNQKIIWRPTPLKVCSDFLSRPKLLWRLPWQLSSLLGSSMTRRYSDMPDACQPRPNQCQPGPNQSTSALTNLKASLRVPPALPPALP